MIHHRPACRGRRARVLVAVLTAAPLAPAAGLALDLNGFPYASQQVGFDSRGDDVPDSFPLYTEAGYTFGRVTGSLFYSRLIADGGTDIGDPGFTFPSNQEEYSRAGGKVYVRVGPRVGASASAFTTLDGRNTGDTTGGSLGLVLRF